MQSVAGGTRNIRITVSRECFALLADAMCEFSKTTSRFRSLRSTVQHACERAKSLTFAREDVERFLSRYPLDGQISIWLEDGPDFYTGQVRNFLAGAVVLGDEHISPPTRTP